MRMVCASLITMYPAISPPTRQFLGLTMNDAIALGGVSHPDALWGQVQLQDQQPIQPPPP
jgi:hypothetical protein